MNYSFVEGMTPFRLNLWRVWCLVRFYVLRPRHGFQLLAQVHSLRQLQFLVKKGAEYLGLWLLFDRLSRGVRRGRAARV